MGKKNDTRRGGHLGQAPGFACSPADTRKITFGRQEYVVRALRCGKYFAFFDAAMPGGPHLTWNGSVTHAPRKSPLRPNGRPIQPLTALAEPVASRASRRAS